VEGQPPFGVEDNALAMLHRVAGGNIVPPRRAGSLAEPLTRMLAADPADRPDMTEIRDELAALAAGRGGNTTTVLLARTNLRANAPGQTQTAAFPFDPENDGGPPPGAAGAAGAAPAAAGATSGAAGAARAGAAPTKARRSATTPRGRALWIAAALVAAMLAGLIAFVLTRSDDQDPSTEANSPAVSSPSAEPTAEDPGGSSDDAGSSGEQPVTDDAPPADPLAATTITAFLQEYHRQVLSDPRGAYARTGPTLRSLISEDDYVAYWDDFSDVRLSDIQAVDGRNTATAFMELVYTSGATESARHEFTFIVGEDDRLILDSDFPI
jgi:hypothetical protein